MPKKVIFDKKIALVLGGSGFIGSNLCDELIKTRKVICVDNFSSGDERNIDHLLSEPDFEFIRHDMVEPLVLDDLPELQKFKIKFQGVQEIYNLACPMSIKNFANNKINILLANSLAVKNALDLALFYNAKFLHFSSSVVYGQRTDSKLKLKETDITNVDFLSTRSAYDEGKRFAETMVMNYQRELNVDAKIVRLFRIYGPRMPLGDGQLMPDFIDNALDNKNLTVYGDEKFSSSFCYVSDCIDACLKMINSNFTGPVNIGSDVDVNVSSVANKIISLLDSRSGIEYSETPEFLSSLCLPDISLARNTIGWLPVVPLEKGLKETVYHIRANKGLKGVDNAVGGFSDFINQGGE
jgi:UDP-glucuronate decarboxylase